MAKQLEEARAAVRELGLIAKQVIEECQSLCEENAHLREALKKFSEVEVGSVYQINENHGRQGWIGAFVLVTEVKSWGIQGFVCQIETHDVQRQAFIRLKWDEIDLIGRAPLVPKSEE